MPNHNLKILGDVKTDDDFYIQLELLRPSCTETNTSLTIAPATFTKSNGQVVRAYVNSKKPSQFAGQTIDLATFTGAVPASNFVKALITIDANDTIGVTLGKPAPLLANALEPTSSNYPIALLNLFVNGSSTLQNVTNTILEDRRPINQNGGADIIEKAYEMMSEQYLAQLTEEFIAQPNTDDCSVDFGTDKTDISQFSANVVIAHYSTRSGTVAGGTGLTLASAPSFTVRPNCYVNVSGTIVRISAVATQQSFTLASALSNGAVTATILEPVITKNLYTGVGSAGQGTRIIDTFSQNVDNIIVDYDDSETALDLNFDDGTPNFVCLASTTSVDTFVSILRPTSKNGYVTDITVAPAAQSLVLTFVPNKTSGDGQVNLLAYACLFLRDEDVYRGGIFNQAYGFTDSSGLNCTFSVVSTKTNMTLGGSFPSYVPGINPGTPYGDIIVEDSGIEIPRRTIGITDDTLPYYTEVAPNQIALWGDFSTPATRRQISVIRRFGTKDTSDDNALFIANFQALGFAFATVVVGSVGQVASGMAQYSSIQAAHDAMLSTGGKIYVLPGTYTENLVLTKPVIIEGRGRTSVVDGTISLNVGSDYSALRLLRVTNNISLNSNACFINEIWLATGMSVNDVGLANLLNYIVE